MTVIVAGVIADFRRRHDPPRRRPIRRRRTRRVLRPGPARLSAMVFSPLLQADARHRRRGPPRPRRQEKDTESQIEDEILSAVEEGEKEGVVDTRNAR